MKPIFEMYRVDETAAFIADELRTLIDLKNTHSPLIRRMKEACPRIGQTQGEAMLAMVLALNIIQSEFARDLGFLKEGASDRDEDEAA